MSTDGKNKQGLKNVVAIFAFFIAAISYSDLGLFLFFLSLGIMLFEPLAKYFEKERNPKYFKFLRAIVAVAFLISVGLMFGLIGLI